MKKHKLEYLGIHRENILKYISYIFVLGKNSVLGSAAKNKVHWWKFV
jgi:hypothetical protein